jgi:hypothetical protein
MPSIIIDLKPVMLPSCLPLLLGDRPTGNNSEKVAAVEDVG